MKKERGGVGAVVGASKERCSVQEIETVRRTVSWFFDLNKTKEND